MKRNQNGVSMISLVITIIVMIILAAVAFGSSTETITNATFADFQNDITEVQQFVDTKVTTIYGNLKAEGSNVNYQQVRNYVAKGATLLSGDEAENAWIPMSVSTKLAATHILPSTAKEVFENELPSMTVNTANASKVEVSYFLTKDGKVFIWPPYLNEAEGNYYINKDEVVKLVSATGTGITYDPTVSGDLPVNAEDDGWVLAMFAPEVEIMVGDTKVTIVNDTKEPAHITDSDANSNDVITISDDDLAEKAVVYYKDEPKAASPVGLESATIRYDASTDSRS